MRDRIKKYVIKCLEEYLSLERRIELLQCEVAADNSITHKEMLEVLAFSKNDSGVHVKGHKSDKTASVAMRYRDLAAELNNETRVAVINQLLPLKAKKERLDRCIMFLSSLNNSIVVGLYIDKKTIKDLAVELHLSERTIQRYRENAIDELVSMYELLEQIGVVLE